MFPIFMDVIVFFKLFVALLVDLNLLELTYPVDLRAVAWRNTFYPRRNSFDFVYQILVLFCDLLFFIDFGRGDILLRFKPQKLIERASVGAD